MQSGPPSLRSRRPDRPLDRELRQDAGAGRRFQLFGEAGQLRARAGGHGHAVGGARAQLRRSVVGQLADPQSAESGAATTGRGGNWPPRGAHLVYARRDPGRAGRRRRICGPAGSDAPASTRRSHRRRLRPARSRAVAGLPGRTGGPHGRRAGPASGSVAHRGRSAGRRSHRRRLRTRGVLRRGRPASGCRAGGVAGAALVPVAGRSVRSRRAGLGGRGPRLRARWPAARGLVRGGGLAWPRGRHAARPDALRRGAPQRDRRDGRVPTCLRPWRAWSWAVTDGRGWLPLPPSPRCPRSRTGGGFLHVSSGHAHGIEYVELQPFGRGCLLDAPPLRLRLGGVDHVIPTLTLGDPLVAREKVRSISFDEAEVLVTTPV